ncbi:MULTISPECIES: site-specific integrase [Pectobacteriaceae]|uniref:Recombinase n=1 Tax=Pectobacterium wasabiae TaxID=55208 RepID=A0AAW3EKA1_9GAMM|nr:MULTISPECIES: site-specific integrase [Pectobacterium]AOR64252.1 integrase [Pectobacterium wasabiae CFBP 3304]EJS92729.1 Shufflon-specific recombinase [Pectobacterium wasabiae CFBP 3304]KFX09261.1 recombinase [Pectobacterium wasabiae]KGA29368.1 recombinase [Pectobacterium wasabiae]
MATIRKRGNYQWEAQIRKRGFPSQTKTFNTKVEAEAWAKMIESEMARGVWLSRSEAESTTLYEALTRYEKEIVPDKKGAVQDRSLVRILKGTQLAKNYMASIRSADVAKLRDEWLKIYAPATVLRRLALLSHVFNVSRKEWGMESLLNPVEVIRKPQPKNARTRRLETLPVSPDKTVVTPKKEITTEIDHIIAATHSSVLPAIVLLALETAMRRSEIAELRWRFIDLDRRVAHLPDTKNGNARDVPLSTKAITILSSLKEHSEQTADKVFNMRADAITRAFDRAVKRARERYEKANSLCNESFLKNLRFHDLRHEATSRLAEIFPMHELTKITGHKDPRMLMRYYHPKAENLALKLK